MRVSFWALNQDGTYNVPLPDVESWTLSPVAGSPGSVQLKYPATGRNFDVLRASVTQDRDLEIAIWVDGKDTGAPHALLMTSDGDDVDEQAVWSFGGHFLEVRMEESVVWPRTGPPVQPPTGPTPTEDLAALRVYAVTAGQLMATLLQEAQGRGELTDITRTFTNTVDSNGVAWSRTITLKIAPGTEYVDVLTSLVGAGMCEWEMRGRELRLVEPGTAGVDRSATTPPLIFRRGLDLTDAPRKHTVREAGTALLVAGGEGLYRVEADATALARRGRRIVRFASQGSITDTGTLTAFTQAQLQKVVAGKMEVGHGLALRPGGPRPLVDYGVHDWALSDTSGTLERLRIAQITLSGDKDGVASAGLSLNDLISDALERLSRRISGIEGGTSVTGTSNPQPSDPANDTMPPAAPQGVVADSLAYNDGIDTYATLIVEWGEVITNQDGTAADDVAGYRVEHRPSNDLTGGWRLGADVTGTTASIGGVGAGIDVLVRVAAYDRAGNVSVWSAEVELLTETDNTPPPVPSTPVVSAYLGQLKVSWSGKGSAGEAMPLDLDRVELHASTTSNFTPDATTLRDAFSTVAGERVLTDLPYGVEVFVRLIAVDRVTPNPNRSAPSAQGSATPTEIGYADIAFSQVGNLAEDGSFELEGSRDTHLARSDAAWSFVEDPVAANHGRWYGRAGGATGSGIRRLFLSPQLPATPDQQFVVRAAIRRTAAMNGDLLVGVRWHLQNGTVSDSQTVYLASEVADTWHSKSAGYFVAPATCVGVSVCVAVAANATAGEWRIDRVEAREAIGTLLIQNAAITNAKVASLDVGKLTAGTLSVAVTNAGIIRTGSRPTGQGTEQDAAGFRAYNAAGVQTLGLTGEFNFIMGELRTGTTGTRLVINPGGTDPDEMRFYPSSGSAFAKLETRTFSGQALIDMIGGTTRSDSKTGQCGCHPLEGYVRWGLPESSTPHSYCTCNEFAVETTGPQLDFIVEARQPNALGDTRKMTFQLTNSSGTGITNSLLWLRWGGTSQPWLAAVNRNSGLLFDNGSLSAVNGGGSFGPIAASQFNVNSGVEVKDAVADARALLDPLAVIRQARAVKFKYTADRFRTPPPTEDDPDPAPVPVPDADVPTRVGVLAEELPAVLRQPLPQPDGSVGVGIDLASQIGVLWGALGQIEDQELRSVTGRAVLTGGQLGAQARTVALTWDSPPDKVPTDVTALALPTMPTAMGRVVARVVPGSVTRTGCTVALTTTGVGTVVVTSALPVAVEVIARYVYAPPYEEAD